ncbi:MAG: hypothetical protein ACLRH1_00365 [Acutalibacteraceae bacterium]
MARHSEAERVSVTAFLFPLLSVLYFEAVFSYFVQAEMTVYKVLFALSAGALALALSRLTPFRVLNFILQTAWLLFCGGLTAAQFLCFRASGAYISLFGGGARPAGGALFSAALESLPFLACLLPPLAVQLTLQRGALLHRGSLPGRLLGADWLEPIGALLLAVILAFVSVTLAFYDADGEASPRHQLEIELMPEASVETFGVVPEAALDFKYSVLRLHGEEVVRRYVVAEDGTRSALSEE